MECPKCQLEVPDDSIYCNKCGHKLPDFKEPAADPPFTEGERKQATILFSDLSGYTSISEKLDPEEVKGLMGHIFEEAGNLADRYEGTVERFFGDEIMVVFGVPKAHENDPIRAVQTALEIHEFVESLSKEFEIRLGTILRMHSGINTGLVITGEKHIGRSRHGLTGDTINLAKRLTGIANAGEILIGLSTFDLSKDHFECKKIEPTRVKGKKNPVQAYKVLSKNFGMDKHLWSPERQVHSEMVGRDKELNKLMLQLAKVVNGQGSVVNVIGEAGIGKSRLLAEFRKEDAVKQTSLFEGKAMSIGTNLAFHLISSLFRNWAQIGENDNELITLRKLEVALGSIHKIDAAEILPFIATLMNVKLTGSHAKRIEGIQGDAMEKLILKKIKDLFVNMSAEAPLVVVLEDLHWADISSLELLEYLYRLAESARILFINVFRPEHEETSEKIRRVLKLNHSVYSVEIIIQPLADSISERLIGNLLNIEGLSQTIKYKIIKRTGGNPFFIEEVVRSLVDEGAIVKKGNQFEVTERLDRVEIPHTVNEVLTARIDRLGVETRQLVMNASVIGRYFFRKILFNISGAVSEIDDRLEYLKNIQFIRDRKRLDEIEYLFKHALAQEAAYELILIQKRKKIHLDVAEAIENSFQERLQEFYGMLAYHYSKGDDLDKAEEYMIKAGEEALRLSASSEAISYYQEALRIYLEKFGENSDPEKTSMIETNIAFAFYFRNEYISATKFFDSVFEKFGIKPSKLKVITWIKVLLDLSIIVPRLYLPFMKSNKKPKSRDNEISRLYFFYTTSLVYTDTLRGFTEVIAALRRSLKFDVTKLEYGDAVLASGSGWFSFSGFSERLSKKILDYAEANLIKSSYRASITLSYSKTLHNYLFGNWNDIVAPEYEDAIFEQNLKAGDNFWIISNHLGFCGLTKVYQGKFRSVKILNEKLSNMKDAYEYEQAKTNYFFVNTLQLVLRRELQEAKISVKEFEAACFKTSSNAFILIPLGLKIQIHLLLNDLTAAEKSIEQAKIYYRKEGNITPFYASFFLAAKFLFYIRLFENSLGTKDKASVAKYKKKAYMSGKRLVKNSKNYAGGRTEALELMGVFHWLSNKQHKAIKWWQKAIKEGEKLSAKPELARVFMQIGIRLQEEGSNYKELNGISATEYLNRSKAMFEDMDLKWDLDILEMLATGT